METTTKQLIAPKKTQGTGEKPTLAMYIINGVYIVCNGLIDEATTRFNTRNERRAEAVFNGKILGHRTTRRCIPWTAYKS